MNNDNNKFKIGDVVILRSDIVNPFPTIMTVNEIELGKVNCVWSSKDHTFSERSFSADALVPYKI